MKVLVVGGGGREHAIAAALKKSPRVTKLYCAPGNGGTAIIAENVPIKATDIDGMLEFALSEGIDFTVVAPDDPLALGMVDRFEAAGLRAFGPRSEAAIIESSKVFSKNLMQKYGIPTAKFKAFDDMEEALAYVRAQGAPIVVKADGLALGKGVVVAQSVQEAEDAVRLMMRERKFGDSGSRVVIEECMQGPEVTVLAFTDGMTIVPMLSSQDHKRAYDNDRGPNTGGMGAFCPSPKYTPDIAGYCMKHIFRPTVDAMNAEGRSFKGVLYFGLMLTSEGPKVVEYNARFGDPEAQPILTMLKTDLLSIMEAVVDGRLADINIEWESGYCCCVVLASGGYPNSYKTGYPIEGIDKVPAGTAVYHAGTKLIDGGFYTSGGRVLGVTSRAATLAEAVVGAYTAASRISFTGMHFRRDIGTK
ncbi:MAG: phosphoribosylamine--glycine ligase [Oscillospiraceae bacterium]|jgi:phosphoribosylamine--glycine ligase